MENKPPTSSVISAYRRRRQRSNTLFVYGAAGLLVLAGLILLAVWLISPSQPLTSLFATKTPTPTMTLTPTDTPVPTDTPTITPTGTMTETATPSAPFTYTVQEGDNLDSISTKFNLGDNGILLILQINPSIDPSTQIIHVGDQILIPNPGMQLFTPTPIPANLRSGTKVPYTVQKGDTLAGIASKFNSTTDAIVTANNLTDPNSIQVGQLLQIPVNLVTPTATRLPTSTPRTPVPTDTPSVTPTP
ncbi:MAG TPA: LysM domain-containing protein [Anaerolineales bacterium]|nr:LysM domain-containing protein [Anaerolineales bacterium]